MNFTDPYANAPNSFDIPMVPGNPPFRQRSNRRRRPHLGCLVTLVVVIVLAYASYTTFARNWAIFGPTSIPVKAHPTLVINSQRYEKIDLPTIHIHAGTTANSILLQVISPGNVALPWNFGIGGFQQNSDSSVIILDGDPVGGRQLDVTVPADTDLKINTNSANIDVTGITGQMTLIANDGKITLTHCNIHGTSLLNSNTGAITVTQSTLNGQVTLSNNTGPITFDSSIGSTGTYDLENKQGSIEATLPSNASFHIHAITNSGSITTDYPGTHVQNKEVQADIGHPPHALFSLNTNDGAITLHMQKGA